MVDASPVVLGRLKIKKIQKINIIVDLMANVQTLEAAAAALMVL